MDRNLLNNATSSDDGATPGYMLTDISKATLANYQVCQQLQEYLLSRIKKNNHNVKYKCLVIIKHVCRSGRADFKKEMSRNVEPIKECLQYRGPPDPLRGDEIYKRVRDAAKEAIDAIYDSNMPVTTSAVAAANRIQGMGGGYVDDSQQQRRGSSQGFMNSVSNALSSLKGDGDNYTCHPGATEAFGNQNVSNNNGYGGYNSGNMQSGSTYSTTSSSGMVGIGNPNFADARNKESNWMEKASNIAINGASSIASATSVFGKPQKSSSADNGFGYTTNRGNNAFGQSNPSYNPSFQPASSAWGNPSAPSGGIVPEIPISASGVGRAGNAAADGEYEKSMIDSLCEPGGLKPVPPEDKLQAFLNVAPTLSSDVIGSCILDLLNSDAWQSRTKALQVISSLANAPGCEVHNEWWKANIDEIKGLLNDDKVNVRNQASKTLKLFDIDVGSTSGGSTQQGSSKSVKKQEISLIDDSDYVQPVSSYIAPQTPNIATFDNVPVSVSVPVPAHRPIEAVDNIFAGMAVSSSSSKAEEPKPTSPPAAQAPASSVFDFLESSTSVLTPASANTVPSQPAPPVPSQPTPPAANTMDAFDFLTDNIAAPAPTIPTSLPPLSQNSNDIFATLNVDNSSQPVGAQYPPQLQQVLGKMSMPVPGMYPMNPGMNPAMNPAMGYRPQAPPNFGVIPPNSMNAMGGFIKTTSPTVIPTPGVVQAAPPSSGFSFIGGGGGGGDVKKSPGGDSFSFVTDEINKASKKK